MTSNLFTQLFTQLKQRKFAAGIALLLVIGIGYFGYTKIFNNASATRYALAQVQKGTIVVSISGSGQVLALDQIDVKPKVSGEIVNVKVKDNQEVKAGALLFELDSRDAQKAVLDSQTNLADAKVKLNNLPGRAKASLDQTLSDSLDALSNAFKDFPGIVRNLKPMFTESAYAEAESDIDYYLFLVRLYNPNSEILSFWTGEMEARYLKIEKEFNELEKNYSGLNLSSSEEKIERGLEKTLEFTSRLLDLARQSANLVGKYQDTLSSENLIPPVSTALTSSQYNQLNGFVSTLASHENSLYSVKDELSQAKEALEKENVDIQAQELLVRQKEFDLQDSKEKLAEHYIRAVSDGTVTRVDVKEGDIVSVSAVLAAFITRQKIAEISLAELDAAKVKIGQRVTLTFDALPQVAVIGRVSEVDALGTESQGVVSYKTKIILDEEEQQIKPGMSVTADIIVDEKQDVLVLPNNAVKSQRDAYYVELVEVRDQMNQQLLGNISKTSLPNPPKLQKIEVGLSNDLSTEVISGLKEGDIVIASVINSGANQNTQRQGAQRFQIPGIGGQQMRGSR